MYDSDDDDRPEIPIVLEGEENFEVWEGTAIGTLRMLGLEGFIRGTETPPLGNTPQDMQALRGFKDRKWSAWFLLHQSTQVVVIQNHIIDRFTPHHQRNNGDPKVLWDGLQHWYNNIHAKRKLDFLRELTSIHYRQFSDIGALLKRAQWLQRRLERAGMPIADEMMKTCLYGGVFPCHYSDTLNSLVINRYADWDSRKMMSDIREFSHDIQEELSRYHQEQQEINRRHSSDRHPFGHGGGSRHYGRRY